MQRKRVFLLALAGLLTLSGCDFFGMSDQSSLTIGTLTISDLGVGATRTVTVIAKNKSGSIETFTATSNDTAIVTVTRGSSSVVLVGKGIGSTSVSIVSASGKSDYIDVIVVAAGADTGSAPTVTSVSPEESATAIAVDTPIIATFSETMDSTTINTASFTLKSGASINVAGTVVWNATNNSATFTPSADLTPSTVYTATISAAVKDSSGTVMASDKVWTFTTAAGTTGTSHALLNWDFQDSGSYDSPTIYTTGGQTVTDILPGWTLSYGVNSAVSLQINIGNEATNNYAILKQTAGASGNAIYMEQNPAYTITSTSKLKVRFQMKSNQSGSTYYYDCSAFSVLFTVSGIQYLVLIRSDAAHVSSGDTRPGTQTAFNVWYTAEIPLAGMQTLQMHLNNVNTGTPTTLSVGDVISTVTVRVNNDIYETWIDYVDIQ